MNREHGQDAAAIRCEWGLDGARAIAVGADIVVVIDVLSFTTSLCVALERGITVFPYRWRDESAQTFAREHDAHLAVGRRAARPGQVSLSPSTIRAATGLRRLVLPSPNGSTIVHELAGGRATVLAASLRNAPAVAAWITARSEPGTVVAVIPAGERWPEGGLRPAVEDLWGAGAVIDGLSGAPSPEAIVARDAWRAVSATVRASLRDCASGRELIGIGFGDDVEVAAEVGATDRVPVLGHGAFRAG